MSTVYGDILLAYYRNPRNFGTLASPTHSVTVNNPLCGDTIHLDIIFDNEIVKGIAFRGEGCVISQASASILTEYIKGKTKREVAKIDKDLMISLVGIEVGPTRLKCLLLSLEALNKLVR